MYTVSAPTISLQPNYLQKGTIGDAHSLLCSIGFSSTVQPSSVSLTWNFTSNDNRVTVIPTTITADDSIGIIYTTVIQFAYLMEEDEQSYICILMIQRYSVNSTFSLQLISKCNYASNKTLFALYSSQLSQMICTFVKF